MRVVGLVAFRNEAHVLRTCLESLTAAVDTVVGLDDGSWDGSGEIFTDIVGYPPMKVSEPGIRPWSEGGEKDLRDALLSAGRRVGGTHFVMLDADECLTKNIGPPLRQALASLLPGQSLALPWIICWKSRTQMRSDPGTWQSPYKDFAFADMQSLEYPNHLLQHLPRTPVLEPNQRRFLPRDVGGVIHFQFAFWETTQIKQAWYRCVDWMEQEKDARRINRTYRVAEDTPDAQVQDIPQAWLPDTLPTEPLVEWRRDEILRWFSEYGIEYFEPINIWNVSDFAQEFRRRTGRDPQPDNRSDLLSRITRRALSKLGLSN